MGCLCSSDSAAVQKTIVKCTSALTSYDNSPHTLFIKPEEKNFYANYRLGKEIIGYGARGEVRLCEQSLTGKVFAVKMINKALLPDKVVKEKLVKKQISMLSVLDHPSILKIRDFYEDGSNYFILMDYSKGGDLFEKIKNTHYFSEEVAARIMKQIFSALAHMHSKSIAHRDIKPENVIVEDNSKQIVVKIIDFDTAVNFSGRRLNDKQGSIYYMAPDIIRGNYTEKCDIWSAGVILYTLLTNSLPFYSEDPVQTENQILEAKVDYEYLKELRLSKEVIHLLANLLTPSCKDRYSAAEACNHGWILKYGFQPLPRPLQGDLYNVLSHALKLWALKFVIPPVEFNKFHFAFIQSDLNSDGVLTKTEILSYLNNGNEEEAEKLINDGYWKNDGELDFYEFMSVMVDKQVFLKYISEILTEIKSINHGTVFTADLIQFLTEKLEKSSRFEQFTDFPLKVTTEDLRKLLIN